MGKKWYGSLNNRLEENRMFCDEIKVGTGVTEYFYSDRKPYEVIEVRDQKHITIRKLDHKLKGEAFSNDWELISNPDNPVYDLVRRGNDWYFTSTWTLEEVEREIAKAKEVNPDHGEARFLLSFALGGFDIEKIRAKGKQTKIRKANISIGVADYYYDYSF